jgi:hypothetical protein
VVGVIFRDPPPTVEEAGHELWSLEVNDPATCSDDGHSRATGAAIDAYVEFLRGFASEFIEGPEGEEDPGPSHSILGALPYRLREMLEISEIARRGFFDPDPEWEVEVFNELCNCLLRA